MSLAALVIGIDNLSCAKQKVMAVLITPRGEHYVGTNWCARPQEVCPRKLAEYRSGEGYKLCEEVCGQLHHAEIDACAKAGLEGAVGGVMLIFGHTYCCEKCIQVMRTAGVVAWYCVVDAALVETLATAIVVMLKQRLSAK